MKENKKRKKCNINIRVTEKDFNTIKNNADNMNMSVSEYVRRCLLKEDKYNNNNKLYT
jgi:predicted DNA binding CopG/RHH family protein